MIITNVTLLKVPFDNTYSNVFQFSKKDNINRNVDLKREFYNLMVTRSAYSPLSKIIQPNKSVKVDNNLTTFNLYGNWEELRDYNYIILSNGNKHYFYFITNITSENDNENMASVRLDLQWDVWHNNIDKLSLNENFQEVSRCHRDRFYDYDNGLFRNYYIQLDKQFDNAQKDFISSTTNNGYEIGYLEMSVTKEFFENVPITYSCKLLNTNVNISNLTNKNNITTSYRTGRYLVYIPLILLKNNKIVNNYKFFSDNKEIKYSYSGTGSVSTDEIVKIFSVFNISNDDSKFIIDNKYASYIDFAKITFKHIYDFTVTEYRDSVDVLIKDFIGGKLNNFFRIPTFRNLYENVYSETYYSPICNVIPKTFNNNNVTYYLTEAPKLINNLTLTKKDYNISYYDTIFSNYDPDARVNIPDDITNELALYTYPFNYISYICNDNKHILVPYLNNTSDDTYNIKVSFNNETNQELLTIKPFGYNIQDKSEFLTNEGSVSHTVNALDDYLIRNGSQQSTSLRLKTIGNDINIFSSILKMGGSFLKGSPTGVIGGVENIVNSTFKKYSDNAMYNALITDLKRTPQGVIHSNFGEDDILYQDRVIFYKESVTDKNILNIYHKLFYLYGYDYTDVIDLSEQCRFWFDYKQTVNCNINFNINNSDKKYIQEIYNKGVRTYFINYDEVLSYTWDSDMKKDLSLNNIEKGLLT